MCIDSWNAGGSGPLLFKEGTNLGESFGFAFQGRFVREEATKSYSMLTSSDLYLRIAGYTFKL